jgi:hypothetical protein
MRSAAARLILLTPLTLLPVSAQIQAPTQSPSGNPHAHVILRIASRTSRFHVGELIPLEMVFTVDGLNRYSLVTMSRDRDGRRIDSDQLRVSPSTGFSDPLQPYLNVLAQNAMGPSFLSYEMAAGKPQVVTFNLNDWMRFDVPGHYQISIRSNRLSLWAGQRWLRTMPLLTNGIELDIVAADPAWQTQQVTEIKAELDHALPPSDIGVPDPAAFHAIERLRHLDTPESTKELARSLRGENVPIDRECLQGLLTSPAREVAIDEVNRLLAQPDFPVSERFLEAFCWLLVIPDFGQWPQRGSEYQRAMATARQQLTNQLAKKSGYALAICLDTLLETPLRRQIERLAPESRDTLIKIFELLPPEKQGLWLSQQWRRVNDPSWIPVLKRLSTRCAFSDRYESIRRPRHLQPRAPALV